jgi:hypothetical protein
MSVSIGMATNFYREPYTLPGLLENGAQFFDEMVFISSPPPGAKSDDESIAIIERWGCKIIHSSISEGFGVVRTQALHSLSTEWGWIMDCDERLFASHKVLHCEGNERYPAHPNPQNKVIVHDPCYNHGKAIRDAVSISNYDCVRFCRRHWMDWAMTQPCQNWHVHQDWQCRLLRNCDYIGFKPEEKMHEKVVDFRTGGEPSMFRVETTSRGIFVEHFHVPAKKWEAENNQEDLNTYNMLDKNSTVDMWLKEAAGVKS